MFTVRLVFFLNLEPHAEVNLQKAAGANPPFTNNHEIYLPV